MTAVTSMMHEIERLHHWKHSRPARARKRMRSHVSKRLARELAEIADALRELDRPPPLR